MAKRSRRVEAAADASVEVPVVGLREPCPCGSGRRYKACHGRASGEVRVQRPFQGFASECDLVALRELVPAATAPMTLREDPSRSLICATVLPMAWPALVREDRTILLGMQVATGSGDASADLGEALSRALRSEPGEPVPPFRSEGRGPRLQELVDPEAPLVVTVHEGFDFWLQGQDADEDVRASLERASAYAHPTARLEGVEAAYWTSMGAKEHLRWVMPQEEEALVTALARLHAAGADELVPGGRLVGMFRAQGLLAPVWDLPVGTGAMALEAPAREFQQRLLAALGDPAPLTTEERRARAGLTNRQVTLR